MTVAMNCNEVRSLGFRDQGLMRMDKLNILGNKLFDIFTLPVLRKGNNVSPLKRRSRSTENADFVAKTSVLFRQSDNDSLDTAIVGRGQF